MKRYSRDLISVLALAALPLLLGCSDPVGPDQEKEREGLDTPEVHQKPLTLVIQPAAADLEVGQTIRLRAALHASDGRLLDNHYPVRWSASRPDRVSIDEAGYATGILPGKSWIKADSDLGSGRAYVTVRTALGQDIPNDGDEDKRKLHEDGDVPR